MSTREQPDVVWKSGPEKTSEAVMSRAPATSHMWTMGETREKRSANKQTNAVVRLLRPCWSCRSLARPISRWWLHHMARAFFYGQVDTCSCRRRTRGTATVEHYLMPFKVKPTRRELFNVGRASGNFEYPIARTATKMMMMRLSGNFVS